ncbi:hypothetical protein [Bartonella queenslandensis]|uniref:hypothetical protein n=1 Tax=Bartonella queenslandensis TaxID=481138 RepID=UPI000585A3C4|nr:hypothetical protein [Bartonella queenslandensis]
MVVEGSLQGEIFRNLITGTALFSVKCGDLKSNRFALLFSFRLIIVWKIFDAVVVLSKTFYACVMRNKNGS